MNPGFKFCASIRHRSGSPRSPIPRIH